MTAFSKKSAETLNYCPREVYQKHKKNYILDIYLNQIFKHHLTATLNARNFYAVGKIQSIYKLSLLKKWQRFKKNPRELLMSPVICASTL